MLAICTFSLTSLACNIADKGTSWTAPCKAEFADSSRDSYPLRSDVTFLNQYPAEIEIKPFTLNNVTAAFYEAGLAERIAEWMKEGYPSPNDGMGLRYHPKTKEYSELLGIVAGFDATKYEKADEMFKRHLGRADLICRIICQFHGFTESDHAMRDIPSRDEFMAGRHYFCTGNNSINFSARPLP